MRRVDSMGKASPITVLEFLAFAVSIIVYAPLLWRLHHLHRQDPHLMQEVFLELMATESPENS